jgi:hypothetical protein
MEYMEKTTYYVSVQAGTVVEQLGAASFEFVIEATPKEIDKLQYLFEEMDEAEDDTFTRSFTPALPYHQDPQNDEYDEALKQVYEHIYNLGTAETRSHIEAMGVLEKITPRDNANSLEPAGSAPSPDMDI